jgi:ribosomal protein S12 methylthiotransferase accessory factor
VPSPPPTAAAQSGLATAPLDDVRAWVDSRFGPVRELSSFRLAGPDPSWWVDTCSLARLPTGAWQGEQHVGAAGTSTDPDEAFRRAAGELLERYSALNARIAGRPMLPDAGLSTRFPRCADDEPCPTSFRGIEPGLALTHVPVLRLSDGEALWVPAGYVHLGFFPRPPEPPVTLPISTGLAFHPSLAAAIWSGLCEVAERDALMLTWWLRRPPAEIDCGGAAVPEPLVDRLERMAAVHLRARLFDITTDFRVPAVACIVTGDRFPHAVMGVACRSDPTTACTKALDEAVSARVAVRGLDRFQVPSHETFDWVEQLDHHSLLYADGTMGHALDFMWSSTRPKVAFASFADGPWWAPPPDLAELAAFAGRAEERGWTVLWTDVTTPDVAAFGRVVKVVVPEMVPLSQSHRARWLATPRLVSAAGLEAGSGGAFNPFPHPFA